MKKIQFSKIRVYVLTLSIIAVIAADFSDLSLGTFCGICPVGFLGVSAASFSIPWSMATGVLLFLAAAYLLGKFFCSWFCPTAFVRSTFGVTQKPVKPGAPMILKTMPYLVLTASIIISLIVKFPVFCLICPIGLFFGFIFAVLKTAHVMESGINLLLFPVIIAFELLLFKKWCSVICPVSALMTLTLKIPGIKARLKADNETCLQSRGIICGLCAENCKERISITKNDKEFIEKCTSCMSCADNCPTKSISFELKKKTQTPPERF